MKIPDSVLKKVQKSPFDNNYFYHAEPAWKRLELISNKEIEYYSDDFALLVNTIERLYKGFLKTKMEEDPTFLNYPGFLSSDHDLNKLVVEIERFVTLSVCETRQDYKERRFFFDDLRKAYTEARYTDEPTFEEFQKVYEFALNQKEIIYNYFNEKTKNKSIENFDLDL